MSTLMVVDTEKKVEEQQHVPLFPDDPKRYDQEFAQAAYYWVSKDETRRLPTPFVYYNSLDDKTLELFNSLHKIVSSIKFDVSRGGKFTKTIKFKEAVTIQKAVQHVEQFLNKKIDTKYWKKIESDAGMDSIREQGDGIQGIRGHALGGLFFLEEITETSPGHFKLECGS